MRNTKFRGLKTNGDFVHGSLVIAEAHINHMPKQHTKTWIVTNAFGNGGWFNIRSRSYVKPDSVGEFTGLTDKNGVDIYEGDVLYHKIQGNRVVIYPMDKSIAAFGLISSGGKKNTLQDSNRLYEVIGNIHQNKDLL